ncbi:HlyD family efflux transporter periplasmic adaptor subunit [Brevibacillus sp. SYP-B805]|uniref:HlyD family secretion protein n=1 Tax=Brevibacillus sp. SYP-B805 TaxID=1578199 RepID=UPI0013EE027A|nr:HlyD family efflux transporter periplasmic adaptor subunit [Brevibacillus sp. SYP-B805]NGQ95170.1 HlyD family efflux transporter periplasmic adaptor subunit [Brevibacillus sp. SYP-B805]
MHKRKASLLGGSVLLLFLTACSADTGLSDLSGTIEAEEVPIVAEVGGSVLSVQAEEGDVLKKNQVIAELDKRSYQIGVNEAEAVLAQAAAKLEEAKAGTRSQTVKKGIAGVQQASANIQLSEARLKQAQANLEKAREQLAQAESQLAGAERTLAYQQQRLREALELYQKGALAKRDFDTQQEAVNQAETQVNQLKAQVSAARAQYAGAQEDLEAARAQIATAKAQWESSAAELDLLQEGSTDYTIKQLIAAEKQAQAKLDLAKLQLEKATITAPEDGILLRKNITEGEVAKAGATLFTMMRKDKLKVKVYIPEAELGSVRVGEKVSLKADAYPDQTFTGVIRSISDKAEFTPKNVQTKNERTKLVFAVTIDVETGLDKLKPGMPVDVRLGQGVK